MIVVATEEFELYHDVVGALRDRGVTFTTIEPGEELPDRTRAVITAPDDDVHPETWEKGVERVAATGDEDGVRRAVEEALAVVRGGEGRTVVGVDPGREPGVAVLSGGTVVAAFQVAAGEAADVIRGEIEGAADPLVRIGEGARLRGARLVDELEGVPVELVDETGTTPYLGRGARGMGDVLAAVNIARLDGERIDSRDVEPTPGELQSIKDRSRKRSAGDRTIDEALARRVAAGELTVEEALAEHREGDESVSSEK